MVARIAFVLTLAITACKGEYRKDSSAVYNAGAGSDGDKSLGGDSSGACARATECYAQIRQQHCTTGDTRCERTLAGPVGSDEVCATAIRDAEARVRPFLNAEQNFHRPSACSL